MCFWTWHHSVRFLCGSFPLSYIPLPLRHLGAHRYIYFWWWKQPFEIQVVNFYHNDYYEFSSYIQEKDHAVPKRIFLPIFFSITGCFFLTVPPDFQYQNKNMLQPTRTAFSRNFQCKKAPRWLSKFFHFGTENGEEQLKKAPCKCHIAFERKH